jgi:predicted TIM-barrel fold metal-dependent hydrolase
VLYGSDWPHPGFRGLMPNDGDLLDLLADWVPDDLPRRSILTTNAQRLYGFTKE